MKDRIEVLREARALISDRKNFTKGAFARDAKGRSIAATDPDAVRFCGLGAIFRFNGAGSLATDYLMRATEDLYGIPNASHVNDGPQGHARILKAFDRAIEFAEK